MRDGSKGQEREREMKEKEDVKQLIDKAEKELNEVFYNLLYEHGDNDGHYELDNVESGFHTLLKYARKWQKMDKEKKSKSKKSLESSMRTNEEIVSKIRDRVEYYRNQVDACNEERCFFAKKGNFEVADDLRNQAIRCKKTLEELTRLLEFVTED